MIPAVLYAVPAFLVLIVVEAVSYRFAPDDDARGYQLRDTATSLAMGTGSQLIGVPWKLLTLGAYAAVYTVAPVHLSPTNLWTWVLLFFADDFAYYWFHRLHHEVRLLWAGHVVHHSSVFYNFSTALRQSWTPMTSLPFWLGLALLGIPPWMIFLQQSVSLAYQFFLHTERIDTLPRPVEWILNTPSHHRVHHGSNNEYLDRNYGGILVIWDRIFGTFEPERAAVRYGITKNIDTYNPLRVATHEYRAIWADTRTARTCRERLGFVLGRPNWQPTTSRTGAVH